MRYARVPIVLLFTVSALLAPAIRLSAQVTTATLFGIVRDTTGAVLPGASVTLTNDGTGLVRNVVTDTGGEFVASAMPAGSYTLTIELSGFKTLTNRGLQLSPGQTSRQTFQIQLGGVEESVTVQAAVPLLETASSKQALSHGPEEISELPLQRRNVTGMFWPDHGCGNDENRASRGADDVLTWGSAPHPGSVAPGDPTPRSAPSQARRARLVRYATVSTEFEVALSGRTSSLHFETEAPSLGVLPYLLFSWEV